MYHRVIFTVIPALLGFSAGFIFAWQVALILLGVVWVIAAWLYGSTHRAGLGGIVGILAMIVAVCATVGLVIAFAIVYGWSIAIDMSWLFRPGVLT